MSDRPAPLSTRIQELRREWKDLRRPQLIIHAHGQHGAFCQKLARCVFDLLDDRRGRKPKRGIFAFAGPEGSPRWHYLTGAIDGDLSSLMAVDWKELAEQVHTAHARLLTAVHQERNHHREHYGADTLPPVARTVRAVAKRQQFTVPKRLDAGKAPRPVTLVDLIIAEHFEIPRELVRKLRTPTRPMYWDKAAFFTA